MRAKIKKTQQKLTAFWDNQAYHEEFLRHGDVSDEKLSEIFKGNFRSLWLEHRVESRQYWTVKIDCELLNGEEVHNINLEFDFDKPLSINEIIAGDKDIKKDSSGIKTRWQGVSKVLLDELDSISEDAIIKKCDVYCESVGWVRPASVWNILNKMK